MKILHINTLYPPTTVGGAERSLAILGESLAIKGHEPHVACLTPTAEKVEIRAGVTVHRIRNELPYWPFDNRHRSPLDKLHWHLRDRAAGPHFVAISQLVDKIKPDVVHTNNLTGFGAQLIPFIKNRGIPVAHTLRDFSLLCVRASLFRDKRDCEARCLACRLLTEPRMHAAEGADIVIGNSTYMIDRHRAAGLFRQTEAQTIYNAVPGIENEPARPQPNKRGPHRFGFVGAIKAEKGIESLLEALGTMHSKVPGWALSVAGVGDADYVASLQTRFAHLPIEWLGFMAPDDIYPRLDTLVIPSIWPEPMPRTLIEAMAYRLNVVVSDAGGAHEVAAQYAGAKVYPREDVDALSALLADACVTISDVATPIDPKVLAQFSADHLASRYVDAFGMAIEIANREKSGIKDLANV